MNPVSSISLLLLTSSFCCKRTKPVLLPRTVVRKSSSRSWNRALPSANPLFPQELVLPPRQPWSQRAQRQQRHQGDGHGDGGTWAHSESTAQGAATTQGAAAAARRRSKGPRRRGDGARGHGGGEAAAQGLPAAARRRMEERAVTEFTRWIFVRQCNAGQASVTNFYVPGKPVQRPSFALVEPG